MFSWGSFFIAGCSGNQNSQDSVDQFSWLIGKWKGSQDSSDFYEMWKKENTTTLSGTGYSITWNGDTSFSEGLRIVKDYEDWYYEVSLPNKEPIRFKLTEFAGNRALFHKPDHDFPQKILYYLPDPNRLTIQLSAVSKSGVPVTQGFALNKTW